MDLDIQFGELEESQPEAHLRPDRNKHFAVVPYEAPQECDLPIFVDLDVMRDIETHALTDTSVELGGVLLGGQYQDEDGRPFVVVTDSLRAQHFEATKGSFKFTHDTWEKISRERDEFPDNLQMVGWYHTHPDWGVFLSSMDMFICDNFFNRPLDLALVVDPCRRDRGMFQWTGQSRERIRRTGGFYLIASRFRQQELELFSAQLEGKLIMPTATDPRFAGFAMQAPSPAPVINIAEPRNSWQGLAVAGMLTVQLLVLLLLAWKLLDPMGGFAQKQEKEADKTQQQSVAERVQQLEQHIDRQFAEQDRAQARNDAQQQVLSAIVEQLEGSSSLVKNYEDQELKYQELQASLRGQRALEAQLNGEKSDLEVQLKKTQDKYDSAKSDVRKHEATIESLNEKRKKDDEQMKQLKDENLMLKDQVEGKALSHAQVMFWVYLGLAALGGAAVGAVIVGVSLTRRDEESEDEQTGPDFRAEAPGDAADSDGEQRPSSPGEEPQPPE